jgi:hypothetical protein
MILTIYISKKIQIHTFGIAAFLIIIERKKKLINNLKKIEKN